MNPPAARRPRLSGVGIGGGGSGAWGSGEAVEAQTKVRVEADCRCLAERQAPHSEALLVCLHGPCMRAGPGAEFGWRRFQ